MSPWDRLANGIILQAVKDYKKAYRALKRNPNNWTAQREVTELIRFFTGPWYSMLTSVDGEYLIRRLNEEMNHEK